MDSSSEVQARNLGCRPVGLLVLCLKLLLALRAWACVLASRVGASRHTWSSLACMALTMALSCLQSSACHRRPHCCLCTLRCSAGSSVVMVPSPSSSCSSKG